MGGAATEDTLVANEDPSSPSGGERTGPSVREAPRLVPGTQIGRYLVLARLGAGAVGVVVAAYDPELDRKVALKLLKQPTAGRANSQQRLLREAQALARLNHTNVVTVHDVGVHDGRVFVAMEFVEGETLGQWLRCKPPPGRDEILRVFTAAGRGLAAAHDAGLVHRDFKPGNVMLGKDGRVRVMDFGLARPGGQSSSGRAVEGTPSGGGDTLGAPLTRTGALMGTPAYMAPEQFTNDTLSPRTDQFAFCVTLFEALYGQRPFAGVGLEELAFAVTSGAIRTASGTRVPPWLHGILLRGLSVDPADRFGDMATLLEAMSSGTARRQRRRWYFALASVVAVAGAAWGLQRLDRARAVAHCRAQGDAIDEVWNEDTRAAVRRGLTGTDLPYADDAARQAEGWLDGDAAAWREQATAACENRRVSEQWTDTQLARAQWCLEERRVAMATLVDGLTNPDAQAVQSAARSAAALPQVDPCTDERSLAAMIDPPRAELRGDVDALRTRLSRIRYLRSVARVDEARPESVRALQAARALEWPPVEAEALAVRSSVQLGAGDYEDAASSATEAYMISIRFDDWARAARVASQLAFIVGAKLDRHDDGLLWARHAEVAIERAGDPGRVLEAHRAYCVGSIHLRAASYDDARREFETVLELRREVLSPEHPEIGSAYDAIGNVIAARGEWADAKHYYERSLELTVAAMGEHHPDVARSLNNLGTALWSLRELEAARTHLERALSLLHAAFGEEDLTTAMTMYNLGNVSGDLGDTEQALDWHERALAIRERKLGAEHPDVAVSLNAIGTLYDAQRDVDAAAPYFERGLAAARASLGDDHPQVGMSHGSLGRVLLAKGDLVGAREQFTRALEIFDAKLGASHPWIPQSLELLGMTAIRQSDFAGARDYLERALQLRSKDPGSHQARARFHLARALWDASPEAGRDRARAQHLMEAAREALRDVPGAASPSYDDIDRWLAEHDG